MDYFKVLNLTREPFSNSPDPDLFYPSGRHVACLQKLEISVRLKRGLNVVLGEVGTGKTTLCRHFIRQFAEDDTIDLHLLLDPDMPTALQFLETLSSMLCSEDLRAEPHSEWKLKEAIKNALFEKAVTQGRTVVLAIDEGQKIPDFGLEILRELLNYESNNQKLLQIVIFAQREFELVLDTRPNFTDRINVLAELGPMSFGDTRRMIRFRLAQCRRMDRRGIDFTWPALWAVHRATRGYPRKIINLCHQVMLALIVQNRMKVDRRLVRATIRRERKAVPAWLRYSTAGLLALVIAGGFVGYSHLQNRTSSPAARTQEPSDPDQGRQTPAHAMAEAQASPMMTAASKGELHLPAVSSPAMPSGYEARTLLDTPPVMPSLPLEGTIFGQRFETAARLPHLLGGLVLVEQETLWYIAEHIYNVSDPGTMQNLVLPSIRRVNPGLDDPALVEAGALVLFPVIPELREPAPPSYWVRLDRAGTLSLGYALFKQYRDRFKTLGLEYGVRLVSTWNESNGPDFSVVVNRGGDREHAADVQASVAGQGIFSTEIVTFSRHGGQALAGLP